MSIISTVVNQTTNLKRNCTRVTAACATELGVHAMQELIGNELTNIPYENVAELITASIQKNLGLQ